MKLYLKSSREKFVSKIVLKHSLNNYWPSFSDVSRIFILRCNIELQRTTLMYDGDDRWKPGSATSVRFSQSGNSVWCQFSGRGMIDETEFKFVGPTFSVSFLLLVEEFAIRHGWVALERGKERNLEVSWLISVRVRWSTRKLTRCTVIYLLIVESPLSDGSSEVSRVNCWWGWLSLFSAVRSSGENCSVCMHSSRVPSPCSNRHFQNASR